jgi:hypothetical protein
MDTTKIDATMAWLKNYAEHIGEGMQMVGMTLAGSAILYPAYPIFVKIGVPMYVIGKCISKFLKPNEKPDDSKPEPLPPVKDIKGGHIRIGLCLGVTALTVLTLLTGCSTVKGWLASPQAHDIERTVRVDVKDIAKIIVTDGKTITTTILADAQEFATNTTEQAAVAKTIVEIAPLLTK